MKEPPIILLADDSTNDLFFMRIAFGKAGSPNSLHEVRDGEEAIAYLSGNPPYSDRHKYPLPTVLLLDLNMPKKNGFEVLIWARAQPGLRRLSIFVISASRRAEDIERAFDLGANSFLVKPTTMEELTSMIRSLLDWLRYNQFPSLAKP